MPATYDIDVVRLLVLSRAWGVLEDADLRATQARLRVDSRFHARLNQLYDFSAVTDVRVTGEALLELSRTSPFAIDARRAVVVSSERTFGMARMYGMASDRDATSFQIFRDGESALRWLGIEPGGRAAG